MMVYEIRMPAVRRHDRARWGKAAEAYRHLTPGSIPLIGGRSEFDVCLEQYTALVGLRRDVVVHLLVRQHQPEPRPRPDEPIRAAGNHPVVRIGGDGTIRIDRVVSHDRGPTGRSLPGL